MVAATSAPRDLSPEVRLGLLHVLPSVSKHHMASKQFSIYREDAVPVRQRCQMNLGRPATGAQVMER